MAEQLENLSTFISSSYLMQSEFRELGGRLVWGWGEMVTDFVSLGKSLSSRDPGRAGCRRKTQTGPL